MLPSRAHLDILLDPQTWTDNPFLAREARRDRKRNQPFISFCWMCGALLAAGWFGFYVLTVIQTTLHRVPWFVGGDQGTAICILFSGIQIYFIVGAAQKHTTRLLTAEANQNTLSSLLLLPATNFQLAVQMTCYPWLVAMRMAIYMLPVYMLCVGLDGLSLLDLIMLYVVFAAYAFSVPYWMRPALSENIAIPIPTKGAKNLDPTSQMARRNRQQGSAGLPGGLASMSFIIPLMTFLTSMTSRRGLDGFYEDLHRYIPDSIASLLTSSIISWPLILARLLVSPLDWFGFVVYPIFFFLPLFLLVRYTQLVRTSEFLSIGSFRELARIPTYLPRKQLETIIKFVQTIVLMGYLWKWGVWDGAFAFVSVKVGGLVSGLSGFGCVIFFIAGVVGFLRGGSLGSWLLKPVMKAENPIVRRADLKSSLRFLFEPFLYAAGIYFLCCLLSRTHPFPPLLRGGGSLFAPMSQILLIGISGTILSFGSARLLGAVDVTMRIAVLLSLVVSGIGQSSQEFASWASSSPGTKGLIPLVASLQRIEILSPLAGMLHIFSPNWLKFNSFLPNPASWQQWVFAPLALGLAMSLIGSLALKRDKAIAEAGEKAVHLDTTRMGLEAFTDPAIAKNDPTSKADTPLVKAFISNVQKVFDNGIVTKDLRTNLRGKWERGSVLTALFACLFLTFVSFHPYVSPFVQIFGGGNFGGNGSLQATMHGILNLWFFVAGLMTFAFCFSTVNVFFIETQKSTLSFLLITPMDNRSILLGKFLGAMIPNLVTLGILHLGTLFLSVIFSPVIGFGALPAWLSLTLCYVSVNITINLILFAVATLFPRLSLANSGWVWILILYLIMGPLIGLLGFTGILATIAGLGVYGFAVSVVLVCLIASLAAGLISYGGMSGMRKKDFSEGVNKRSA